MACCVSVCACVCACGCCLVNVSKSQADADAHWRGEEKAVLVASALSNSFIVENLFTKGCCC